MKKYTIEELEQLTGENIEDVLGEFYDSCARTGHADMYDNARYFVKENDLVSSEIETVYQILTNIDNEEREWL